MKKVISRRIFFRNAVVAGAAAFIPDEVISFAPAAERARVVSVKGSDYYAGTMKAVEMLGGIGKFVRRGDRVAVIANSPWNNPGTYTNPDITLALLRMCMSAGASRVTSLLAIDNDYWFRGSRGSKHKSEIAALKISASKKRQELPKSKILKYAEYSAELLDADVYINIPIAKDHLGTRFTGNLKNLMGSTTRDTNHRMHLPDGKTGEFYGFIDHLSQCIADLNTVRMPDLSICDVTEVIINNGPTGPGNIKKVSTVLAGTDALAVDVTGAMLIDRNPADILIFRYASEHKLGEARPDHIDIEKTEV
jgi:uncharacterized protein (DUF362 family)